MRLDAGSGDTGHPLSTHLGVGVFERGHDAAYARGDQRVAAGRRAAVVSAGLQCDVGGGAADVSASIGRIAQGHHLGVSLAGGLGMAAADHLVFAVDDHAADAGIGVGQAYSVMGQGQGVAHGAQIVKVMGWRRHGGSLAAAAKTARSLKGGRSHAPLCSAYSAAL